MSSIIFKVSNVHYTTLPVNIKLVRAKCIHKNVRGKEGQASHSKSKEEEIWPQKAQQGREAVAVPGKGILLEMA